MNKKRARELTRRRNKQIIQKYLDGYATNDIIGNEHGLSREMVRLIVKAAGITPSPLWQRKYKDAIPVWCEEYLEDRNPSASVSALAKRHNVPGKIIRKALVLNGIKIRVSNIDHDKDKECGHCGVVQPPEEYCIRDANSGARLAFCRKCSSAKTKKYYHTEKGRRVFLRLAARQREKPSVKAKRPAWSAVRNAIQAGTLEPPTASKCNTGCGRTATIYHHYAGYEPEHWLDVEPVCARCHNNHKH
jgi:hypothetical protein